MNDDATTTDLGSLKPVEKAFIIDGKRYVLREASEGAHVEYQNMSISGARMNSDTNDISMGTNLGRLAPFLISQCLWETNAQTGEPTHKVLLAEIMNWPARITKPLFKDAKEISGLGEQESPERKALMAAVSNPWTSEWFSRSTDDLSRLDAFRRWVQELMVVDPKLYRPLWKLVEPRKQSTEDQAKN